MKLRIQLMTLSTQVGHPNGFDNGKTKQKSPVFEICELHLMKNTKKKLATLSKQVEQPNGLDNVKEHLRT